MSLVSLYDEASLWMTPSGAKDGKLFSELPTDGSGDFTFSRGSNLAATRVGPTGLIEKGRENLLVQSNQFDSIGWLYSGTNVTSGQNGYDGTNDAWLLTKTTASFNYIYQNISQSGVKTLSLYAKAGTLGGVRLFVNFASGNSNVYFNLNNGTSFSIDPDAIDAKIESVGNGWYRCSITDNEAITQVRIYPITDTGDFNVNGNILIQDAQLEIGLAATDYIESGATTGKAGLLEDEPRLDYSGGATCPSLLLEPSRTNLVPFSEYWKGYFTIDTDVTISVNVATSPEGVQNAGRLKYDLASRSMYKSAMGLTGEHSVSFWVKGDGSNIGKTFNLRLQGTSIDQNIPITLTSDWVRVEAQTNGLNILELNNRNSTTIDTGSLLLYGFQIEQGSYATSYIPNHSGGSVTRGVDDCKVEDLQSNGIVGNTWTYFFEWGDYVAERNFEMKDSTSFNFLFMVSRLIRYIKQDTSADTLFSLPTNGTSLKALISYDGTTLKGYLNGSLINSVNDAQSSSFSDFDFLRLDRSFNDTEELKQLLIFPTALTDSECIKLTTL